MLSMEITIRIYSDANPMIFDCLKASDYQPIFQVYDESFMKLKHLEK